MVVLLVAGLAFVPVVAAQDSPEGEVPVEEPVVEVEAPVEEAEIEPVEEVADEEPEEPGIVGDLWEWFKGFAGENAGERLNHISQRGTEML